MIVLEGLAKSYGARKALSGVDLHVRAGELFAYLGPNGAGKTTTIRILTGLTLPDGGRAACRYRRLEIVECSPMS